MRCGALLAVMLSVTIATTGPGRLRLPGIFGNHMVLQRDTAALWGTATPGRTITAEIAGVTASTVADPHGTWRLALDGLAAGGPHDLTISGDGTLVLHDVLIGDVWLGAGQSNIRVSVRASGQDAAFGSADCSRIRFFTVAQSKSWRPASNVQGHWEVCTPEAAREFSAVASFFGRDLESVIDVPIGLVVSAWGATSASVWVPPDTKSAPSSSALPSTDGGVFTLSLGDLRLLPRSVAAARPIALAPSSSSPGGRWTVSAKPGSSARFTVHADPTLATFSGRLRDDDAWASATTALSTSHGAVDVSDIRAIALRIRGTGEFRVVLGQPSITDGDRPASEPFTARTEWSDLVLPLSSFRQGGWGTPRSLPPKAVDLIGVVTSSQPPSARGVVFNGMIAPLTPLRLRGVLWYQGEADVDRGKDYGRLLRDIVQGWRAAWHDDDLPFIIVQLPGYGPRPASPGESGWAEVREAQAALALPATTTVTAIDLGDVADIHPKRKAELGGRLARAAARLVYGQPLTASGPVVDTISRGVDGSVIVRFAEDTGVVRVADGLTSSSFALSDDGVHFLWADARLVGPGTVEVRAAGAHHPVEVRYAWADNPDCSVTNADGLPAAPFRARID